MEKYTVVVEQDEAGYMTVKRVRDGKTARVKAAWLRTLGYGDYMPVSRTKVIRLDGSDWE